MMLESAQTLLFIIVEPAYPGDPYHHTQRCGGPASAGPPSLHPGFTHLRTAQLH